MKTIMTVLIAVLISTQCSAAEVANSVDTLAGGAKSLTGMAVMIVDKDDKEKEVVTTTTKPSSWKWLNNAKTKYDEVRGGRETIQRLEGTVEHLTRELRLTRAKMSFLDKNTPAFSKALEQVCFLYDAGGIRESLEASTHGD